MRTVPVYKTGSLRTQTELAMPIIAASPMADPTWVDDKEYGDDEAIGFSATVHVHFFEDIFHLYGINVHWFVLCQLADNCSTKKPVADLLQVPNFGFNNHKLHIEVRRIIYIDHKMKNTIESVHNTMTACR